MAAPRGLEIFAVFAVFIHLFYQSNASKDVFSEEMLIKPLQSGHLYTHFQFTTDWEVDLSNKSLFFHYHLFPKSLGEVLSKYSVQELHLSLTQGLWKNEKWGYPVVDAPTGAELWVWFEEGAQNVDVLWMELINVLSGMFCASLNFMDTKSSVTPKLSFKPQGATTGWYNQRGGHLLRYAALPRENVCTENLTPWKKLLPCGSKAGLATLFNAIKLYDASYHSLGVHFRPTCQDEGCSRKGVELSQTLSVVFEPTVMNKGNQDWSFKKLFGWNLPSSCPLASNSKIYVDLSSNKTKDYYFTLSHEPHAIETVTRGGQNVKYAVYDVPSFLAIGRQVSLSATYNKPLKYGPVRAPILHAHRFQTGYGQDIGGIACLIYNNHPSKELTVVYMETVPWFLRVYYHTIKAENYLSLEGDVNATTLKPLHTHYVPGKDRQQPYHLEMVLKLPPKSVTKVSLEFERALLKWTEYPPDANHGFYVNTAVISAVIPTAQQYVSPPQKSARISAIFEDDSTSFFLRMHTESLLVTLPTPDFSMPYNVICLACTVVAIAFGSIHNLTTRRFTALDPTKQKGFLTKLKEKIFRKKPEESQEAEEVTDSKESEESKDNDTSGESQGKKTEDKNTKKDR